MEEIVPIHRAHGSIPPARRGGSWRLLVTSLMGASVVAAGVAGVAVASAEDRPSISSAVLIDAATDKPVAGRGNLSGEQTVDLGAIGTHELSVQAFPSANGGSVRFTVEGGRTQTESFFPYVLTGDSTRGDIYPWKPKPGRYTIVMTPYSEQYGRGRAGTPLRITLTVTDGGVSTPGKPSPSKPTPTPSPSVSKPVPATPRPGAMPPTTGRYLFVSGNGDDKRSGTSAAQPVRTLQKAADLAKPGDTVLVMNGTYANGNANSNVVTVKRGGTASRPVTIAAHPGHKPLIKVKNWSGIQVQAPHVIVQGLTIEGNAKEITRAYAESQKNNRLNPITNGNGIYIVAPTGKPDQIPHHVTIRDNVVRDVPGGGISTKEADYVTIERNTVTGTSHWTVYGTSGISLLHSRDIDGNTGYKMIVRQNTVSGNRNYIPWLDSGPTPHITDGNGIIVDDNRNSQIKARNIAPYRGRTLVENNVAFRNGGGGVHIFSSDNVDVVHNTTYHNSVSPEIGDRDLNASWANNIRFFNNVSVSAPGHKPFSVSGTPGRAKGSEKVVADCNLIAGDPKFVNPAAGDFRLRPDSPAMNAGCGTLTAETDNTDRTRSNGKADLGAFES
ncbi:right-handed parallel beta-helix repeat-containing protein [Micromonospora sp. NPDC049799]|uniref:right-handed parallel beta-helix repeat-containing protein n=1 Tax=Micromonospora sp. NPDC049799 TaxID=3154741 RepID=UPI0033E3E38F